MRRLGAVLLAAAAVLCACAVWAGWEFDAPGPLAAAKTVVVPKNARLLAVAEQLGDEGVVAHPWVFAAGALLTGKSHALKAGEYEFVATMSARAVADLLASGRVVQHRLTLPEGMTSAEAMVLIDTTPALDGTLTAPPAEGSLLPDTYFFVLGTKRSDLVSRMQHAMTRALAAAWRRRAPDLPLATPQEALILASIVEKETGTPDERARVAGVYVERLRAGMRLQADPTVLYGLTKGGLIPLSRPLDHADLAVDSPYNTYLVKGLPPTPIANPGIAAIAAALAPDDRGDLYFVADGTGHHSFAHTLEEQNRHIAALRRLHGDGGVE